MRFKVLLTADAARDLDEIVEWIAMHDAPSRAVAVLERIDAAIAALVRFPQRGPCPPELLALGVRDYRETSFKPYRIIYRTLYERVLVLLIVDGRRDMQTLLARRLLEQ